MWNSNSLILGSASPRRKELLEQAGLRFRVVIPEVDELRKDEEGPSELVQRLATEKARAVAKSHRDGWVIGADTIVVQAGDILGKPANREDAHRMLSSLSGTIHSVLGGVAIVHEEKKICHVSTYSTEVQMRALSPNLIEQYLQSGEADDKAGAYGIQGLAAQFVERVNGSYSNVVGLNVAEVVKSLEELGAIEPVRQ